MALVVVAEDEVDHQVAIAEAVHRLGHEATLVDDGQAALNAVVERRPDLVIADVDMPVLDGLRLCRAIRADPGLAALPIVLITAYLPPSDPQLTSSGADAVIRKPFALRDLTAVLREHLGDGAAAPAGGTALGSDAASEVPAADATYVDALLNSLDTGVVACDRAGRLLMVNRALRDMLGEAGGESPTVREWSHRSGLRHHDGTPLAGDEIPLVRALAGEHVRHAELLTHDRDGRPRWLAVNARPICHPAGTVLGAVAAVHDVSAPHRARQFHACKTEVLRVLAGSPDTATAAREILRALGTTLGWPYARLWLVDETAGLMHPVASYLADGERVPALPDRIAKGHGLAGLCWERRELVWVPDVHAEDSPILAHVTVGTAFRSAGGVPVRGGQGVIGVLTFFSNSRQEPEPALAVLLTGIAGNVGAYLQQRRSEELARHLAATTEEYVALVGHELRTPVTSICAYTDLVTELPDSTTLGDVRHLLEVVSRNNDRLRTLVEQLLELAALESGHVALCDVPVEMAGVVREAVAAATPRADARGIVVTADLAPGATVTGDADRLRQVVDNVLDNAVKFSHDDSAVGVVLRVEGDHVVLTVSDTGIGVPAEERAQLFRRLFRGGNARHSGIPGAGLGLALSRVIVERHHGTISLTPHRPTGTTSTVRLPHTGH
jgi:PAS domain S-box-containing protein